jgi:carboxyl-terminal processing protease
MDGSTSGGLAMVGESANSWLAMTCCKVVAHLQLIALLNNRRECSRGRLGRGEFAFPCCREVDSSEESLMNSFSRASFVCLACLVSATLQSAYAQPLSPTAAAASDPIRLLQTGFELEKSRDWVKSLQHYEVALRAFPDNSDIKRRLLISRLHNDVVRRSTDSAIDDMISRVSASEALDLYSEVLARLEMSYVEPLPLTDVVRSGTAYLEVALTEPGFVSRHLHGQAPDAVEKFRTSIHRVTLANRINNRFDARSVVAKAAEQAQKQLNIEPTATVMQFVFGAVCLLDPYSSFLSSGELNEVESQIEGNFVGLGIALQPHEAPLRILNVIPGGPALEAGLETGDMIVEIGSVNCVDVGAERAADLLRGPEQSQVRLLIRKVDGSDIERVVVRRRVEVPSIEGVKLLEPAAGVAYLKINSFQKTTATELDEALWSLQRQGMQSLIIDVRGNPGGWLDAAIAVADRFLAEGGIVSTRGKNGIENQNYSATRSGTWQVPLVLLIDDQSASASEILAGAIRDNNRGVLVGNTTYGKGSVQGLFHTKSLASGIRLTVSKFYSPSGQAIAEKGVQPNVAVSNPQDASMHFVAKRPTSGSASEQGSSQDKVLEVAIEQARRALLAAQSSAARN